MAKRKLLPRYRYTLLDVIQASAVHPMPEARRTYQLTRMYEGLRSLETSPEPTTEDWRVCSDAVNLMETLIGMGTVEDGTGLLMDAITALAEAGRRHQKGHAIRLDARGIQAVRAILEDYATVLESVPERTMLQAHRLTERRIIEILAGRRLPHDVEVMDL